MTLDTRIVIHQPMGARQVFSYCRTLIGAHDGYSWEDDRTPEFGHPSLTMHPGQGLPAWLIVYYGNDAPLDRDEPDPETGAPAKPDGFIEVSFDTAYGYNVKGAGCSDLHAWLVRELGHWLDDRGVSWSWRNEFTGEWFPGCDGLDAFGDADRGALATEVTA